MSIAEELYTGGYITYPRTDNTHYPEDLDERALVERFAEHPNYGDDAESLLDQEEIEPTAGEKESTDHPPIHPTGEFPEELGDDEWGVYELVVRRFLATVAPAATWAHLRVVADADGCALKANGKRLVDPGYHVVYPYRSASETHVPDVEEGDDFAVTDVRLDAKQTQPPRRYGQSRLIERMEAMGVGTKSTRHETLQKLYDRGYVEGDPPRPTALARGVVEAAEQFAEHVVDEKMTAQLERDMTAITEGKATLEEVTAESREMLRTVFEELHASREEVGDHLRESLKADRRLGPCPECGSDLLVRRSRQGSYFVGCDGYPDCQYTLSLPNTGEPQVLEEPCEEHGLAHVKMLAGRNSFVHGCPQCEADRAEDTPDRVIGTCPECGEDHGGELAIKTLRSGSRLVGCTRYPDCEYSLPLPRQGDIEVLDSRCEEHNLPELVVRDGDDPWELGCPICNYREYRARQAPSGLTDLEGIGEKTREKLADAGVESLEDLRTADPAELAEAVRGISADRVREWQARLPDADAGDGSEPDTEAEVRAD
jgi:DNA topoisomerase-1